MPTRSIIRKAPKIAAVAMLGFTLAIWPLASSSLRSRGFIEGLLLRNLPAHEIRERAVVGAAGTN